MARPCSALMGYSASAPVIFFDDAVAPVKGHRVTMRKRLRVGTCTTCLGGGLVLGTGRTGSRVNGAIRVTCPECQGTGWEAP